MTQEGCEAIDSTSYLWDGTYLGPDTVCDGNPCPCPCCCDVDNDGDCTVGGDMLTVIHCIDGDCSDCVNPPDCDVDCDGDVDCCDYGAIACRKQGGGTECCDETDPTVGPEDLGVGTCSNDGDCPVATKCVHNICYVPKNRYVSFVPYTCGASIALRITAVGRDPVTGWVQEPEEFNEPSGGGATVWISRLHDIPYYADSWPEVLHVGDREIAPRRTYGVQAICSGVDIGDPANYSDPLILPTVAPFIGGVWGDVVGTWDGETWTPPNGDTNAQDVLAVLDCSLGDPDAPSLVWCDLAPCIPDAIVDDKDVDAVNDAAAGLSYPCSPIPAVSAWGLAVLTLLLLTGITMKSARRRSEVAL